QRTFSLLSTSPSINLRLRHRPTGLRAHPLESLVLRKIKVKESTKLEMCPLVGEEHYLLAC
ncbi:MAG TPA: hypothetical protein VFA81_04800, partial [Burkholderiales bacterium]|nr:hypothetical protein [Burkholderiales bacterium]